MLDERRRASTPCCTARRLLPTLAIATVALHVVQIVYYADTEIHHSSSRNSGAPAALQRGASLPARGESEPPRQLTTPLAGSELMIVTATQPSPCTTQSGDFMVQLGLKNKWQYALLHGHRTWVSTELLSPWDLGGQWNKLALLSALADPDCPSTRGVEWLLWMDDDSLFGDMEFALPLAKYDADGVDLVLWGDEEMTYTHGHSEGVNTGIMLVRKSEWARRLLASWVDLASSALKETFTNHDQGALVHLLHTETSRWRGRTLLERNFTMNGHWPEYAGKFARGSRRLKEPVWGSDALPFVLHFSGCQMCRGHSYNGTWTEAGVETCRKAFMEAFTFADDQVLGNVGLRHPRLGQMTVRASPGTPLQKRHARLTKCMPKFLVVGTQKGGTSSLHFLLKSGWHKGVQMNEGEKEVHFFSFDDVWAKGATTYQQRWDGADAKLGECLASADRVRGEVSASYLDYPKAAERAAQLLPSAKIVVLLREPVSRLVSSFNMKWQVETCGKLTWTRTDCYNGITSVRVINENTVAARQRQAAIAVWNRCNVDKKGLDHDCLKQDFVQKLGAKIDAEIVRLNDCQKQKGFNEELGACLGMHGLEQQKLYALMEDNMFIYRSMYVEQLNRWLKVYPTSSLLVIPSEHLKDPNDMKRVMQSFARFVGLPEEGPKVHHDIIFKASPASKDGAVHENGRTYIGEAPPDLIEKLRKIFCPKNQELAQFLLDRGLIKLVTDMPWLATATKRDLC